METLNKNWFAFTLIAVIFGLLILVFDHHSDRGAGGATLENARQYFDFVVFFALGCVARLAGLATI